jgi:hypothetical protein
VGRLLAERDGRIIDVYAQHDRTRFVRIRLEPAECSSYRSRFANVCGEIHRLLQFHVFERVDSCIGLVGRNYHERCCVRVADADGVHPTAVRIIEDRSVRKGHTFADKAFESLVKNVEIKCAR